ncbi:MULTISPECIES: ABC transporter ATP-binding protein [Thermotoga]|uniref:ABC transporter ATP-binding protein n=1 Tax=Thermotoga TaxID=2335 RepID=UPI0003114B4B|nr:MULTISPECIES: ABC transporter ATP-binding protein [Thermotoga]AJG39987.1 ABC transporter [Thermotoga sp. RQ7]KFZ21004.1 ABC transporter ATP-binding protein [Thermotoga neapolitana LA10]
MIVARGLTRKFGDFVAVDHVDLVVRPGEIYGFLGPNGAGKTTTIRMLTGVLKPTEGEIEILGMNMKTHEMEIKKNIGVVPDEPKIYTHLTGKEFLDFIVEIYGLNEKEVSKRIAELCEAFKVDYLGKRVGEMSHGMKQKLMLVSVFMRRPRVIFLDEPTVGLDAKSAKILKLLLRKYADEGATIFLTTHILEIAEKMCDRIGIINKGRLIAEGTMEELRKLSGQEKASLEDLFLQLTAENEEIEEIIREL